VNLRFQPTSHAVIRKKLLNQYLIIQANEIGINKISFPDYVRKQGFNPKILSIHENFTTNKSKNTIQKLKKSKQTKIDLSQAPSGIQETIINFLDERSIANLSASCGIFYKETIDLFHWKDKLIHAGCSELSLKSHLILDR
jgi:hypothetical protein